MITNPNPRNFYSKKEMTEREQFIPVLKQRLLGKIKELQVKIETEEKFPENDLSLDDLSTIDDEMEQILNKWHY